MKAAQHTAAALMMLLILSAAAGQETQTAVLPLGAAAIADLKGDVVFHSPQGEVLSPQRGLVLQPDSVIETAKGSVLLQLQDGSQVLVKPNSRVVLQDPAAGQGFFLHMLLGKIIAKIQKRLGETPSFRMGTPTAVITVRGTQFSVEVNKKQRTYVEVYEGLVEVQGMATGGRPVLLQPGYSTYVGQNRNPDMPRQMGPGEGPGSRENAGREDDHAHGSGSGSSREDDQRRQSGAPPPPPSNSDRDH